MANDWEIALEDITLCEPPTSADYERALRRLLPSVAAFTGFDAEALGERISLLTLVAQRDLGLARLLEGHLDAVSILHEAKQTPRDGALYAIWASGGPADSTRLETRTGSVPALSGVKPFCSGAGIADRALIWVGREERLVEVALADGNVTWDRSTWCVDAMTAVNTWTATFHALPVARHDWPQPPGWYFRRPGFWRGALCPAACWLGGALGLIAYARDRAKADLLAQRQLGLLIATGYGMQAALHRATRQHSHDRLLPDDAYPRALAARHTVEAGCLAVITQFSRMFGPRPLTGDPAIARRLAELSIYIRQCHGDRDLAELGSRCAGARE